MAFIMNTPPPLPKRCLHVAACEQTPDGYIPVHWRLDGRDRQGVIEVWVSSHYLERRAIAELCALNHLMNGPRPIYGNSRAPASSMTKVTTGCIRKLLRGKSDKGEIVPFARFLFLLVAGFFSKPFCLEASVGGEFGLVMQSS